MRLAMTSGCERAGGQFGLGHAPRNGIYRDAVRLRCTARLHANCDRPASASIQAPYIESVSARLRDGLLNGEIFHRLEEVRCITG